MLIKCIFKYVFKSFIFLFTAVKGLYIEAGDQKQGEETQLQRT